MGFRPFVLLLSSLLIFLSSVVLADPSRGTLSLGEVLSSVERSHPGIGASRKSVEAAESSVTAARGGFDPRLYSQFQADVNSLYPSQVFASQIKQPTTWWGTEFFVGYRLGRGLFAPYDAGRLTASGGELSLGFEVPLLKNSWIDDRRFDLASSQNQAAQSIEKLSGTRLKVALVATETYLEWAAFHQKVAIRESVLSIALQRREALKRRHSAGDVSRIVKLDNERLILNRQAELVEAQRKLREAVYHLSMFYRDRAGAPLGPGASQPPQSVLQSASRWSSPSKGSAPTSGPGRPELRQGQLEVVRLDSLTGLMQNQVLPKLNLKLEGVQGLGTTAHDPSAAGSATALLQNSPQALTSPMTTELRASVVLEFPLFFRTSQGQLSAARANREVAESELELVRNEISIQTSTAMMNAEQSARELEIAKQELELCQKLEEAERTIFGSGGSSLIDVNIREETTAAAAFRVAEAQLGVLRNLARYWSMLGYGDFDTRFESL